LYVTVRQVGKDSLQEGANSAFFRKKAFKTLSVEMAIFGLHCLVGFV